MPPADTFELVVEFGDHGTRALAASRSRLVLVKPFSPLIPDVVWVACDPEPVTSIRWSEIYGIYAGGIPSPGGDPAIAQFTMHPASDRTIHHFLGTGFGTPEQAPQLEAGRFAVMNHTPFQFAFGLTQRVTVNGVSSTSPVNSSIVPGRGGTAQFTASPVLYIWTQVQAASGQLITGAPASRLVVTFEHQPIRKYRFDVDSGVLANALSP